MDPTIPRPLIMIPTNKFIILIFHTLYIQSKPNVIHGTLQLTIQPLVLSTSHPKKCKKYTHEYFKSKDN